MKRRAILAGMGATSVSLTGCLNSVHQFTSKEKSSNYEACGEPILVFSRLPDDVKREVKTAFEEGEYNTDGELLYEQVAGESVEALRRNDFYYEAHIDKKLLGGRTLSFTQTSMTYDSPVHLEIRNMREGDWRGSVRVSDVDGEILVLEKDVVIESYPVEGDKRKVDFNDERIRVFPVTDEWGEYNISLNADQEEYDEYEKAREDSFVLDATIGRYAGRYLRIVIDDEGANLDDELGRKSSDEGNASPERPCYWSGSNELTMGSSK